MISTFIVKGFNRFENALDSGLEKCAVHIEQADHSKHWAKKHLQTRLISVPAVYGLASTSVIYHLTLLCFHQIGVGFLKVGEKLFALSNKTLQQREFLKNAASSSKAKVSYHAQKVNKLANILKQVPLLTLNPHKAIPQLKQLTGPSFDESIGRYLKTMTKVSVDLIKKPVVLLTASYQALSKKVGSAFAKRGNIIEAGLEKSVAHIDRANHSKSWFKKHLETRLVAGSAVSGLASAGMIYHLTLFCFHQVGIGFLKVAEKLSSLSKKTHSQWEFIKRIKAPLLAKASHHAQKVNKQANILKQVPLMLFKPGKALPRLKKLTAPSVCESIGRKLNAARANGWNGSTSVDKKVVWGIAVAGLIIGAGIWMSQRAAYSDLADKYALLEQRITNLKSYMSEKEEEHQIEIDSLTQERDSSTQEKDLVKEQAQDLLEHFYDLQNQNEELRKENTHLINRGRGVTTATKRTLEDKAKQDLACQILGLPITATYEEITGAIRKHSLVIHPDKCSLSNRELCSKFYNNVQNLVDVFPQYLKYFPSFGR